MRRAPILAAAAGLLCGAMGQSAAEEPLEYVVIDGGAIGEAAPKQVDVPPFRLQPDEVTQKQYGLCVDAGACTPAAEADAITQRRAHQLQAAGLSAADQPVIGVTGAQAAEYCAWAGARLPTMAEYDFLLRHVVRPGPSEYRDLMLEGDRDALCAAFDLPAYDANVVSLEGQAEPLVLCAARASAEEDGPRYILGSAAEWAHNSLAEGLGDGFAKQLPRGGSWMQGVDGVRLDDDLRVHADVGLRCAQDLN